MLSCERGDSVRFVSVGLQLVLCGVTFDLWGHVCGRSVRCRSEVTVDIARVTENIFSLEYCLSVITTAHGSVRARACVCMCVSVRMCASVCVCIVCVYVCV